MPGGDGVKLANVRLQRRIGRGSMADVYLGSHIPSDSAVAVKIFHIRVDDEDGMRRFLDVGQAAARLDHPNIVQVHDFAVQNGRPFIVMEYVAGPSLGAYLEPLHTEGRTLPMEDIIGLVGMMAAGLDHAHVEGILHRDVKPANVLLRSGSTKLALGRPLPRDATALLSDFGVARITRGSTSTSREEIMGTLAYMAPEQVVGGKVDTRADVYSLGVVLYEMLAGRRPFGSNGNLPGADLFKHFHEEIPPLRRKPAALGEVIKCALAKDPAQRYLTAGELLRDLRRASAGGSAAHVTMSRRRPKELASLETEKGDDRRQ